MNPSRVTAVAVLTLLGVASVAQARTIRVPGDYPGLGEAVAAARSGDRIMVEQGQLGANTEITDKSRLTIIGVGDPVLDASGSGVVLTLTRCDRIYVRGLVLANAGTDGLRIFDSERVVIRDCTVRDSDRMGMLIGASERVKLLKNTVDGAGIHGIWLSPFVGKAPASAAKVIGNVVSDCGEDGLRVEGDGHVVSKNEVARCGQYGIHVLESVASKVLKNDVSDAGNGGIWVDGEKNRIDKNHVRHTVDDGIGIYGDRNRATKNVVEAAEDDGIELEDGTRNKLIRNTVRDSGENGIALSRTEDNKIIRNDVQGSGAIWNGVDLRDYGGPDLSKWKSNKYDTSDFTATN